jgi:2-keto-4-pentenoate hydratase/2-oxohepta-3-ene-1,7-dioic acid hydratase in catechol pathway
MNIVKIEQNGKVAAGFLEGDTVHVVGDWFIGAAQDAPFALGGCDAATLANLRAQAKETVALADVSLAPPVDPRAKILCVGMNYRDHVGEIKQEVAANPTIFTRYIDTLVGQGQAVIRPTLSETFDFEGEIAIIIGRGGRHIPVETALDHVSGYTCFMDGSVREYQRHSLTAGKNFWRSGAMGPWIVPAQNFAPADPLLETRLNGEKVQGAHASQMIFDIPHAIAYCSRFTLLRPGDVIATGTPGGVGSRREPPLWMKAGDRIEVSAEGIGTLSNPVADEG